MDIKELINWCWKHKWWFLVSLPLCLTMGAIFYLSQEPKYNVSASIMLRTPDMESQQGEIMSLMGVESNKSVEDEINVLQSRDLMVQVIDSLQLTMVVEKRQHLRWMPVYPLPELTRNYDLNPVKKQVFKVKDDTSTYRITIYPRPMMVDILQRQLNIKRSARESQIILLSTETANPQQAIDILNLLLTLYNESVNADKYSIALQSQNFLNERITTLKQELMDAETALDEYKMEHQITDIAQTAIEYQSLIENYEHQLEDINYELRILDKLDEQLRDSLVCSCQGLIYGTYQSNAVNALIMSYNDNVSKRFELMGAATANNPQVKTLDYLMEQQRLNLARGCNEARTALQVRKAHINGLHQFYTNTLAQLPEIERSYIELQRTKDTKEEQYLYVIQKKEESNLILASSSIPVKLVSSAQKEAKRLSPSILKTGVGALLIGLLLPLLVFFFGIFKKEFLCLDA